MIYRCSWAVDVSQRYRIAIGMWTLFLALPCRVYAKSRAVVLYMPLFMLEALFIITWADARLTHAHTMLNHELR